jgi:hypothetical protein
LSNSAFIESYIRLRYIMTESFHFPLAYDAISTYRTSSAHLKLEQNDPTYSRRRQSELP